MNDNLYRSIFEKHNIKYTKQRELIYSILEKYDSPLTVDEIFDQCINDSQNLSLSTIYRVLDVFVNKKIVLISGSINKKSIYELNRNDHKHHIICLKCNKKLVLDYCPLDFYKKSLTKSTDFEITDHQLALYGYCSSCRNDK